MMQAVSGLALPLLGRLSDYYEDAAYEFDELGALLVEIATVSSHCTGDHELLRLLAEVRDLAAYAAETSRGLEAIAD